PDKKGRVWIVVGELKGIFLLNTNDEIEFFGENEGFNSTPLDITEGKDGFLYVSATSANSFLYRFDEVNNHFENITPTNLEIVENDILFSAHQMAVDNYGIIWFATSYGIFTF